MKKCNYVLSAAMMMAVAFPLAANDLINISTRAVSGAGDEKVIAGFTIDGIESKRMIIGAGGPALTASGVPNVLADPNITIFNASGEAIASNSNWAGDADVAATSFAALLDSTLEPAIVLTLEPGAYTVVVEGDDGGTGNSLVFAQLYASVVSSPVTDTIVGQWTGTKTVIRNQQTCIGSVTLGLTAGGVVSGTGTYVSGSIPGYDCETEMTYGGGDDSSDTFTYAAPIVTVSDGDTFMAVVDGNILRTLKSASFDDGIQTEVEVYTRQ